MVVRRSDYRGYGGALLKDISAFQPSLSTLIAWPFRCETVCLGTVEVYRRTCCCQPIIIDDPRIPDLIRDLSRYVEVLPKFPPKPPGPDPAPFDPLQTPFFNGGAINEFALNAPADLAALTSLHRHAAARYITARPHLLHRLCLCGPPNKVATGTINPDGTFNICWRDFPRLFRPECSDSFAYVVKQTIGGTTTTIYDGVAAGAWYSSSDTPELLSYDPKAFTCSETGTDPDEAVIYLDLIGDTESHELTTPDSTGWDRVQAPTATSGLLFPNPDPSKGHLRNLGRQLELTYLFSEQCKAPAIDAKYYRVSVAQADSAGNPTGTHIYFGDGLAWQKVVGGDIVPETLGPFTIGTEANLYKIPYASDANWTGAGRYHALIDTTRAVFNVPLASDIASAATNHLVTLEVFNSTGERIRPVGTPASGQPGAEVAKGFEFRRWFQPGGSVGVDTHNVPFAALTHLFCWDNRAPVADITSLVMNGLASQQECQFLVGSELATFGIEYRAYVPDQRFQQAHRIGWIRGLNASTANGGVGTLPTPFSPTNAGKPPAAAVNSGTNTFGLMLRRIDSSVSPPVVVTLPRCSFAVTLTTEAKTTDGANFYYPYAQEVAAFALELQPSP